MCDKNTMRTSSAKQAAWFWKAMAIFLVAIAAIKQVCAEYPFYCNNDKQAIAINHNDGNTYFFKIVNSRLQYSIDQGATWLFMRCPQYWRFTTQDSRGNLITNYNYLIGKKPATENASSVVLITTKVKAIAADNNRIFVQTTEGDLYWCCIKTDIADWVSKMLGGLAIGILLECSNPIRTPSFKQTILSLFCPLGLGAEDIILSYKSWVQSSHTASALSAPNWNKLNLNLQTLGQAAMDAISNRDDIVTGNIVDIAVGNWPNTVVTYYVLMNTGEIKWIDEEVVMLNWKTVPGLNASDPPSASIDASNSVIALKEKNTISCIRWDFHQPEDFFFGLVDWVEHESRTINIATEFDRLKGYRIGSKIASRVFPLTESKDFRIDTYGTNTDGDAVWFLPEFYEEIDLNGSLGDYPNNKISAYPVWLYLPGSDGCTYKYIIDNERKILSTGGQVDQNKAYMEANSLVPLGCPQAVHIGTIENQMLK